MRSEFYLSGEMASEKDAVVSLGPPKRRIIFKASGNRLLVVVKGDPARITLINSFRAGLERGMFRPRMRVLIDLTEYFGIVNWSAIFAIGEMIPPDSDEPGCLSRIAYVVRDDSFDALIKISGVLFDRSNHRTFDNHTDASTWLMELKLD